ncbi:hypothetical protein DSO57_1026532 [Entomophthora muscae]|uniref:Uncharacterized protein n=1 Tax=Entomophthora muscae TaxID=34485 RepID=A0ACC2T239_9FUNG|nr:hypothetical protein DSO57_1026532 [Entomophthora muscae]
MPPSADELSESMKQLTQGMANMTTYLAGGKQPRSNLTCNNCTRDGHVASTCRQKCNHCGDKNHPYPSYVNNKKVTSGSTERQLTLEIRSSNESKPGEDNQASKHLNLRVTSSNVDDHSTATNPEPYGIPMDEEDRSFLKINMFKETVKTDIKKTKSKQQIIPSTEKNRKVDAWKLLKETIIPTPLINLLGSSPSLCADMIQAIGLRKFKTSDDVMASISNLKTNSSNSKNEMGNR